MLRRYRRPAVARPAPALHRATQFAFAKMSRSYGRQDRLNLDRLLRALIRCGFYQRTDLLYVPAIARRQSDASVNLRGFFFNLVALNSPAFEPRRGIEASAVGQRYWNTLYNPAVLSGLVNWGLLSASVGRWTNGTDPAGSGSRSTFGVVNASQVRLAFADKNTSNNFSSRIHNSGTNLTAALPGATSLGWEASVRSGANANTAYIGLSATTGTAAQNTGVPANALLIGARSADGVPDQFADRRYAAIFAGGAITDGMNSAAFSAFNRFLSAFGAA